MLWCAGRFAFPLVREELLGFYDSAAEDGQTSLIAAVNAEDKMVGFFMMRRLSESAGSAHLGFIVINPKYRGRGYGKTMLLLALQAASDQQISRLTLAVFERNQAAHRCYTAVGFRDEAYQQDGFSYHGKPWPRYRMAIDL